MTSVTFLVTFSNRIWINWTQVSSKIIIAHFWCVTLRDYVLKYPSEQIRKTQGYPPLFYLNSRHSRHSFHFANNRNYKSMSTIEIYNIRQQLGNIGIPILLVSGNIGNVLLIIMLIKSLKRHPNSCSLYLLFASFGNLFVIDTALISTFYGMSNVEPIHFSNVICKLRWFGGHALFMLTRCCSKLGPTYFSMNIFHL